METEKKLRFGCDPLLLEQLQAEQLTLVPPGLRFLDCDITITIRTIQKKYKQLNFICPKALVTESSTKRSEVK
jgi:hypothetical protein